MGSEVVRALLRQAHADDRVLLLCTDDAIPFYARLGFEEVLPKVRTPGAQLQRCGERTCAFSSAPCLISCVASRVPARRRTRAARTPSLGEHGSDVQPNPPVARCPGGTALSHGPDSRSVLRAGDDYALRNAPPCSGPCLRRVWVWVWDFASVWAPRRGQTELQCVSEPVRVSQHKGELVCSLSPTCLLQDAAAGAGAGQLHRAARQAGRPAGRHGLPAAPPPPPPTQRQRWTAFRAERRR